MRGKWRAASQPDLLSHALQANCYDRLEHTTFILYNTSTKHYARLKVRIFFHTTNVTICIIFFQIYGFTYNSTEWPEYVAMHTSIPQLKCICILGMKCIDYRLPTCCITEYITFSHNTQFGPRFDSNKPSWHWTWFSHCSVWHQRTPAEVQREGLSASEFTVNDLNLEIIKQCWGEDIILKVKHSTD